MLIINNQKLFGQAVAAALVAVQNDSQGRKIENWVKQIARAAYEIEHNPFMHFDAERELMIVVSTEVYEANGKCDCRAGQRGLTCWHRVAKRIWMKYLEFERTAAEQQNRFAAPAASSAYCQTALPPLAVQYALN
jgi:hypothetical protein